ncbi:IgGFc-binding protein-like isoform X2 [Dysidea avara]|uniref:IgGFc-binding protein-like isoform X2 n=1 Tax=Dysidea avara TaxID=196820 RepID=UPI00332118A9
MLLRITATRQSSVLLIFITILYLSQALVIEECREVVCPRGSVCKLHGPSNETYCDPSCDVDNGGCASNQTCSVTSSVTCVTPPCPSVVECSECEIGGIDLVYILDSSFSIGRVGWEAERNFTVQISSMLNIGLNQSLVGLIRFARRAEIIFNLQEHTSSDTLIPALQSVPRTRGRTNTHTALRLLRQSSTDERMGLREGRPHVAIIVTDGKSHDRNETIRQANLLHEENIYQVYAAGIGTSISIEELNAIASSPSLVFLTNEFDAVMAIQQVEQNITQQLCRRRFITIQFSQSIYRVNEDNSPVQPTLVLNTPLSVDFIVEVFTVDESTIRGDDYTSGPYSVTFPAGVTRVPFDVPINDDRVLEINERFNLVISPTSLPRNVTRGNIDRTTVIIRDNDDISVHFNLSTYTVGEGDEMAQPILVLSDPSSTDITVQIIDTQISATGGVDYISGPYIVTFPAGVTKVSFDVLITDDNILESDEVFNLTIDPSSLPRRVTVTDPSQAVVTIIDNEIVTVSFNQSVYSVDENNGPAQPVLVLSNSSSTDITVQVFISVGSATGGGIDYNSGPYTVTFPAGVTSVVIDISITDDDTSENEEDFTLIIDTSSLPTRVNTGRLVQSRVVIVDDDGLSCDFMGIQYRVGDVIQPNCSTVCTCLEDGFSCRSQSCFVDGPTCRVYGDPHYRTFDNLRFDFQGGCEYVLTQPCNSSEFIITGSNVPTNAHATETSEVRIIIPSQGLEIHLTRRRGGTIAINGDIQLNNGDGLVYQSSGVEVLRTGGHPYVLLTLPYPVAVHWDGRRKVRITVSTEWEGMLCGLCGTYSNDRNDDFTLPDGSLTASINDFGDSWLYSNNTSTCEPSEPEECPDTIMATAQSRCSELMRGVFSVCNSVVDPTSYIDACVFDYCACNDTEREGCYCDSLSTYADECASNGVVIPNWRNFFCPISCPEGMLYQQCGQVCPQRCDIDETVDCIGGCVEGCFCPSGYIFSNGNCTSCQQESSTITPSLTITPATSSTPAMSAFIPPVTTMIEPSTPVTAMIEPSTPVTTMAESSTPVTTMIEPSTPVTTMAESSTPVTTMVESSTPVPIMVESSTPVPIMVESSTPVTTMVASSTPVTTMVESSTPVTTMVESSTPVTTMVASSTPVTTMVESSTPVPIMVESSTPVPIMVESSTPVTTMVESSTPVTTMVASSTPVTTMVESSTPVTTMVESSTPVTTMVESSTPVPIMVESSTPVTTMVESSTPVPIMVESSTPVTTMVASSTPVTIMVESSTPVTTMVESSTPVTTMVASSTPVTTMVESSTPVTTMVESSTPVTIMVESSTPVTTMVESSTPVTTMVASSTPVTTMVESSTPVTTMVESSTPVTIMVESSTPVTTMVASSTPVTTMVASPTPVITMVTQSAVVSTSTISPSPTPIGPSCEFMGIQYRVGDVIQPNCSTVCACLEDGFSCRSQSCFVDGPTCRVYGDPHYRTYDNLRYDFQGGCEYVLTQPCNSSEFIITGSNVPTNAHATETSEVRIIVPSQGLEIHLTRRRGGTIAINGDIQLNNGDGLVYQSSDVEVLRTGGHPYVLLTLPYPVAVHWDGRRKVRITVSTEWEGMLCGLCGTYSNDRNDDFTLPDGSLTTSINNFGNSWLYSNNTSTCEPSEPEECPDTIMSTAQSRCSELMRGVFSVCNSVVDPTSYIDACVFDYCACNDTEREGCYCDSLSTYADECASNGVVIPNWRNFFCSISCPEGMVYQQCGQVCPQRCDIDETVDCIGGCVEGCFCPSGQILENGVCTRCSTPATPVQPSTMSPIQTPTMTPAETASPSENECDTGGIDLVFVLESSISTTEEYYLYEQLRQFTAEISSLLNIGLKHSLVGVILYSTDATIHFNLVEHTNESTLLPALKNLPFIPGISNTHRALSLLLESAQNDSMRLREGHPHVAIVLTDGRSTNREATIHQANKLHRANIFQVYAVGFGDFDVTGLTEIASSPSFVFSTTNFNFTAIQALEQRAIQQFCQSTATNDDELSGGEIAAIVIGVIIAVILMIAILIIILIWFTHGWHNYVVKPIAGSLANGYSTSTGEDP